jgi:hypothetical protein
LYKVVRTQLDRTDPSCVPVPGAGAAAEAVQVRGNAACLLALHDLPPEVDEHEWDTLIVSNPTPQGRGPAP